MRKENYACRVEMTTDTDTAAGAFEWAVSLTAKQTPAKKVERGGGNRSVVRWMHYLVYHTMFFICTSLFTCDFCLPFNLSQLYLKYLVPRTK